MAKCLTDRSRRRRRRLGLAAAAALGALAAAWVALFVSPEAEAAPAPASLPAAAVVPGAAALPLPKQTPSRCGVYALAVALAARTGDRAAPEALGAALSHDVPLFDGLSGTFPWRIVEEARRRGLDARGCTARGAPPAERIACLRRHIAAGRPVIVLIESERRSQHYVLALGYGPGAVDIYDPAAPADPADPARTLDLNGPRPGNRTLSDAVLADDWSRGGVVGLFTWWYLPL
jgi:hypothetical protein